MTHCLRCLFTISLLLMNFSTQAKLLHPAKSLKKITVVLEWMVNPDHAALFTTQQQGYFKQHGLYLNIIAPANPNQGIKLVAIDKADVAIAYGPQLLIYVNQGLPLIRIATSINQPLTAIAVLKNGPVNILADLKDKQVGGSPNIDKLLLTAMFKHQDINPKGVRIIGTHFNEIQSLLAKQVAGIFVMRNVEPLVMKLSGHPTRLFFPETYGVPAYDEFTYVINIKNSHAPWIKAFIAALKQGTAYLKAHPKKSWQLFAKQHTVLNTRINYLIWMRTYAYFANDPAYFDKKRYLRFADFFKQQGLIKHIPTISRYTI
ncbi:MAG: ABC transporter substrate-binding protein [Gammaproteobacteria bacterium]|nr:ABC transporter substrate-binding protein [Gammaproteobacteria bacterium]